MKESIERLLINALKLGEELLEKDTLTEREEMFLESLDEVIEKYLGVIIHESEVERDCTRKAGSGRQQGDLYDDT